jgi:hypothetical protein
MSSVPLLLSLFPEGRPAVFHEVRDFNSGMPPWDPYEPFVHLVRFAVSQQDAAAFTGVVDLTQAPYAPGGRVDAFAPGFAAARASRRLDLGAVYVAEQQGEGLTFRMAWKGWSLRVDGRPVAWGQRLAMDAGAHALELEGRVPASAKGPLPLGVSADDDPDPLHGRLIPLDIRYGLLATLSPSGGMAQGRPLTRFEPLPLHRFAQPEGIREPFGAALESGLAVPMDGTYEFRVRLPFHGRVLVGGQTAFDSMPGGQAYPKPIRLSAGRPLPLRVECALDGMPDHERTLVVDVLGPRDEDWKALPWNWCLSGLGAGQIRNRGSRAAAP